MTKAAGFPVLGSTYSTQFKFAHHTFRMLPAQVTVRPACKHTRGAIAVYALQKNGGPVPKLACT